MSFGIYWEPATPPKGIQLPTGVKYILAQRYFGGDGSSRGNTFLGPKQLEYLRGIADATSVPEVREGAEALMAAIEKHRDVRVWIGDEDD